MADRGHGALRLAIVGATGVLGGQLLELIGERAFPFSELKLFSSEKHFGESIEAAGEYHRVAVLREPSELCGFDLAVLAVARPHAEAIVRAAPGPILVDLSAAPLAPGASPLVAPGFTSRDQIRDLSGAKLFHTPHPAALAIATILNALGQVPFAAATLMLSASWMGRGAISHLVEQSADLLNGRLNLDDDERQAAFNAAPIPSAGALEAAIAGQISTLIGQAPPLVLQSVQIPVLHGMAVSLYLPYAADTTAWTQSLRSAPGVLLIENEEPANVVDAIGQEALLTSLTSAPAGVSLWCAFDNARRAALAALWIAECLLPAAEKNLS